MTAALLAVASVIAVELALRVPLGPTMAALLSRVRRIAFVIRSPRISDTHKERVLPAYALRLAGLSFALLGLLLVIAFPFVLVGAVAFGGMGAFGAAMVDPWLLLLMLGVAAAWFALRSRIRHGL